MKEKKPTYSNIIYGFDIETTTTDHITAHYLSSFISVNFDLRSKSNEDIINAMSAPRFCRTSDDVNEVFEELNARAAAANEIQLIYIHNLAYEFDYLIKNINFVIKHFNNSNALFIKPRIPLFLRLANIELRCSYKLLNKSLKKCGDNLGYKKLEIDYKNKWYEFSKLPAVEYEYNKRDVQLMLLAVLKECSNWPYITEVKKIPYTSTGLTRKNNEYINTSAERKNYAGQCSYQKLFTKEYVDFLERTFSGGYTHANAFYVNKPIKNVLSFDIVSSYIDTILHRKYPRFFREYKGRYRLAFFKHLAALNTLNYEEVINNYSEPFKCSFMANITLLNVRAKILKGKNLILPISINKCDKAEGVTLDNGRVYRAHLVALNVTEVDYFILRQFYDFDIIECNALYYTNFRRYLSDYVLISTREYLHEKSTLKAVLHKFESRKKITVKDFYNKNKGGYIYPEEQCKALTQLDRSEQEQVLNDNYRAAKNKLNAQYGINVQKLLNPIIKYDLSQDIFINDIEEHVSAKVLYRDFTRGLYITAYSRLNLFCYALYILNRCNVKLIYSDTDSWKCGGNAEELKAVNNEYNKQIEKIVNNSIDYNVGYFDFECMYSDFCTLGCKKYIVAEGKRIITTIAGVNKYKASQAYTELYKSLNYDFELLCKIAFNPCTILSDTVTEKLVTKYNVGQYNILVTDENGDSGIITGNNMVELVNSDYILMDCDKATINEYINYFSELQHTQTQIIPTFIYRDSSGTVTYKYITDWRESLKILRGQDVNFINIVN